MVPEYKVNYKKMAVLFVPLVIVAFVTILTFSHFYLLSKYKAIVPNGKALSELKQVDNESSPEYLSEMTTKITNLKEAMKYFDITLKSDHSSNDEIRDAISQLRNESADDGPVFIPPSFIDSHEKYRIALQTLNSVCNNLEEGLNYHDADKLNQGIMEYNRAVSLLMQYNKEVFGTDAPIPKKEDSL